MHVPKDLEQYWARPENRQLAIDTWGEAREHAIDVNGFHFVKNISTASQDNNMYPMSGPHGDGLQGSASAALW